MLLNVCVSAFLLAADPALAQVAPPPAAATGDATAMLKEKIAKLDGVKSYSFELIDDGFSGFGRGRGGRGGAPGGPGGTAGGGGGGDAGAAPPAPTSVVGMVEVGKGEQLTRGETVAFRRSGELVYKKGEAWELYVAPDFSGFGGGGAAGGAGGGRGGGGPPGGGGAPGGAGGPPGAGGAAGGAGGAAGGAGGFEGMRELFAVMPLASQQLPHELVKSLIGKVATPTCTTNADGSCTFTAALTDDGADDLSGAKRMRERFGGGGGAFGGAPPAGGAAAAGGGPAITAKGTATVTFDAAGMPTALVIETVTTSQRGETKRKQAYTMKAFGTTKVDMPAGATAKFSN